MNAVEVTRLCLFSGAVHQCLIFSFFNFWYTRVFNSFGQNKMALKISAIGVVLNIMLDPTLYLYLLN